MVGREPLKGRGQIDLKISHASIGNRIIEFKGWWNPGRKNLVQQLFSYLTEFDGNVYIVIVNTAGNNIISEYQGILSKQENSFKPIKWEEETFVPTSYKYYKSTHEINSVDRHVFHFIIKGPKLSGIRKIKRKSPFKDH
ncbi:MAG: hypothetical protein ACRDE5_02135 [Ginsengibacter sp.]